MTSPARYDDPFAKLANMATDQKLFAASPVAPTTSSKPANLAPEAPADRTTARSVDRKTARETARESAPPGVAKTASPTDRTAARAVDPQIDGPADRRTDAAVDASTDLPADPPTGRPAELRIGAGGPRIPIRHTLGVFKDQIQSLNLLQLQAVQVGEPKPTITGMVQDAIDAYLAKHGIGRRRSTDR
jgi:hypothetical protein